MKKLTIAAAALAAVFTMSALSANAEPQNKNSIPAQDDSIHYYRTLLSDEEKLVYDGLLNCFLSKDPSQRGDEFRLSMDPAGEEFSVTFRKSYNALIYDHPELFWLSVSTAPVQYSYRRMIFDRDHYRVSFQINEPFPERDAQMAALDKAADEFLAEIDLDQSAPMVALQIHDKLIDLVVYDQKAVETLDRDLAHTAYGALVENSRGDDNTAVCDGYSYAYEYLLQKAGIRSAFVAGVAGETEEAAGNHSWNLVELSGEWYEVDATWDDISAEEGFDEEEEYSEIAEEAMNSEWYIDKLTHFMFNITTDEITYFEPDEDYRYTNERGWVSFLGDSVHIRYTEEQSETTGDYMSPKAPIAEGTKYSYENLLELED